LPEEPGMSVLCGKLCVFALPFSIEVVVKSRQAKKG